MHVEPRRTLIRPSLAASGHGRVQHQLNLDVAIEGLPLISLVMGLRKNAEDPEDHY